MLLHLVMIGCTTFGVQSKKKMLQQAILQKGLNPAPEVYSKEVGWHKGNINWNQVCNGGISIGALAIAEHIPEIGSCDSGAYAQFDLRFSAGLEI